MRIISHRGNLVGAEPQTENQPSQIEHVLKTTKFDVEVDIWLIGEDWYLGHDRPQYPISFAWMTRYSSRLWFHTKNLSALERFILRDVSRNFNYFWHEDDKFTLTSCGVIWAHPTPSRVGILVHLGKGFADKENASGICTDYPLSYEV